MQMPFEKYGLGFEKQINESHSVQFNYVLATGTDWRSSIPIDESFTYLTPAIMTLMAGNPDGDHQSGDEDGEPDVEGEVDNDIGIVASNTGTNTNAMKVVHFLQNHVGKTINEMQEIEVSAPNPGDTKATLMPGMDLANAKGQLCVWRYPKTGSYRAPECCWQLVAFLSEQDTTLLRQVIDEEGEHNMVMNDLVQCLKDVIVRNRKGQSLGAQITLQWDNTGIKPYKEGTAFVHEIRTIGGDSGTRLQDGLRYYAFWDDRKGAGFFFSPYDPDTDQIWDDFHTFFKGYNERGGINNNNDYKAMMIISGPNAERLITVMPSVIELIDSETEEDNDYNEVSLQSVIFAFVRRIEADASSTGLQLTIDVPPYETYAIEHPNHMAGPYKVTVNRSDVDYIMRDKTIKSHDLEMTDSFQFYNGS